MIAEYRLSPANRNPASPVSRPARSCSSSRIAEQKYVTACHPQGELILEDSLRELETEFPKDFLRIHRNALVGRRHIAGLERSSDGTVAVSLLGIERCAVVSRRHLAAVRKMIGGI